MTEEKNKRGSGNFGIKTFVFVTLYLVTLYMLLWLLYNLPMKVLGLANSIFVVVSD